MTVKEALCQICNTLEGITLPIREAQAITEISTAASLARSCIQAMEDAEVQERAQQEAKRAEDAVEE